MDERFASLSSLSRHIDHVYGFLAQKLARRGTAEWLALFEQIGVPAMPLTSVDSLLDDPHIKAVELLARRAPD